MPTPAIPPVPSDPFGSLEPSVPAPAAGPLGILLVSGTHERAHFAFVLAAGAAAVMRPGTAHPRRADVVALRQRIGPV